MVSATGKNKNRAQGQRIISVGQGWGSFYFIEKGHGSPDFTCVWFEQRPEGSEGENMQGMR